MRKELWPRHELACLAWAWPAADRQQQASEREQLALVVEQLTAHLRSWSYGSFVIVLRAAAAADTDLIKELELYTYR